MGFWTLLANEKLKGKTIKIVRYMTQEEVDANGWYKSAVVIIFTDDTYIIPMADDEGNESGVIWGIDKDDKEFTLPSNGES